MSEQLYNVIMESMKNRENPTAIGLKHKSPKELATSMVDSLNEFKDDTLTEEEIQDLEAEAGYFDDSTYNGDDTESYPSNILL